jgi:hypothetical protein
MNRGEELLSYRGEAIATGLKQQRAGQQNAIAGQGQGGRLARDGRLAGQTIRLGNQKGGLRWPAALLQLQKPLFQTTSGGLAPALF